MNLYLDAQVVAVLDAMSLQQGLSRSVLVERMVRDQATREGVVLDTALQTLAAVMKQQKEAKAAAEAAQAAPVAPAPKLAPKPAGKKRR